MAHPPLHFCTQTYRKDKMRPIRAIRIDSRKMMFFLFVYYLCLDPIGYMLGCYFAQGNLFFGDSILHIFYLEQIVLLSTVVLILHSNINVSKYLNFQSEWTLFLFLWICIIVSVSFFDVGKVSFWGYYHSSTRMIGRGFCFILLGLNIHSINDMFQEEKARRLFYTIAVIFIVVILLSAIYNPLAGAYPWYLNGITRSTVYGPDIIFDYLYISDTVALLLLFIMSRVKKLAGKLLVIIFGSFLIILCGSRAALICFAASGLINFTIHFLKSGSMELLGAASLTILLIIMAIIYGPFLIDQVNYIYGETYRFNPYTFTGSRSGGSYLLRKKFYEVGLRELRETWILGRYLSDIAEERHGTYIHNWLSFLSAFGIGPFLLSVCLMITSGYTNVRRYLKNIKLPINELLFLWSIFMIMIIVLSRDSTTYYIWFVLIGSQMTRQRTTYCFHYETDQPKNISYGR